MTTPEFSRPIDVRQTGGEQAKLSANEAERAALAKRFDLVRIDRLEADLALERESTTVNARGALSAEIVQMCAVSGEDLPVSIREELSFRFVPQTADHRPDEEIELDAQACDELEYAGSVIDLGEAVAQSLALAIDPFATGPLAEQTRKRAGLLDEEETGPFAALKGLRIKE